MLAGDTSIMWINDSSMATALNSGGHSAQVKIRLLLKGGTIPVAQLGRDFLLLSQAFDHPPASGILVLQVDQSERRWDVHLPQGVAASSNRVAVVRV